MSLKQKVIRGVIWSLIQRWGSQAITFIVFLLLARLLKPQAFGLVALATVFLNFVQLFTDQGLSSAIVQRRTLEPGHLDTAFWINIALGTLLTLISVTAAELVGAFFKEPNLTSVVRWLSLSFLLSSLNSVQDAILTRELNFKALMVKSLLGNFAGGIAGVTMALLGFGVWSLVGRQLVSAVIDVVVLWKASKWRPGFRISLHCFNELFSYGINVVGLNILKFVNRRSGDLLIGYFLGPVALGYYTVAYRIISIVTEVMIVTIQRLALPVFSRLQQDLEKLRQTFFNAVKFTSLVATPAFLGLSALAPEIVVVVFGEQWKPSIPVMQVLGLISLLYAGLYYNDPLIMALGKPQWSLRLTCLEAILNFVFFVVAVRWGIVAVASAFVIRGYLMFPIVLLVVNKVLPFKWDEYFRQYLPQLIAGLGMVFALLGAKFLLNDKLNVHILLPAYIVFGVAVYVTTILVIAPKLLRQAVELFRSALPQSMVKKARLSV
jgi:PST family polysaccharide transporter